MGDSELVTQPPAAIQGLSLLELEFVSEYLKNGGNQTRAYMTAARTNNYGTAATAAWKLLKKAEINEVISSHKKLIQDKLDINLEKLVKPIADGLEAVFEHTDKYGTVVRTTIDHNTRLRAAKDGREFFGYGTPEPTKDTGNTFNILNVLERDRSEFPNI
jgi:hypothetical protein